MTIPAQRERHHLADSLERVGPDAPTLDDGWDTRMLAAHIVLRDSRPDAMPGILVPQFAGYTEKVQKQLAKKSYETLVDDVRNGPPFWNATRLTPIDRVVNTAEFFVHHEDVRRAEKDWDVRALKADENDDLYGALKRMAPRLMKPATVGITLVPEDGHAQFVPKTGDPMVTVSGPVGELVMWSFGRKKVARVDLDGAEDAIAAAIDASFSL